MTGWPRFGIAAMRSADPTTGASSNQERRRGGSIMALETLWILTESSFDTGPSDSQGRI